LFGTTTAMDVMSQLPLYLPHPIRTDFVTIRQVSYQLYFRRANSQLAYEEYSRESVNKKCERYQRNSCPTIPVVTVTKFGIAIVCHLPN
jgi:hypothetical protein